MTLDADSRPLDDRLARLHAGLQRLRRVAVALSGGVDSSYLLAAAVGALGTENVLAVTVASELVTEDDLETARATAALLGVEHVVLSFEALSNPDIAANRPDRCYHCKREILQRIAAEAGSRGMVAVLHGASRDDREDYRPGARAAAEAGALAPLDEAGLSKREIRELARQCGLPAWNRPSQACLASRVPYYTPLTAETLGRITAAEDLLRRRLGVGAFRVRDHLPVARLELPPEDWPALLAGEAREEVVAGLRRLGYRYVTLDLEGLRSGSMNDVLVNL